MFFEILLVAALIGVTGRSGRLCQLPGIRRLDVLFLLWPDQNSKFMSADPSHLNGIDAVFHELATTYASTEIRFGISTVVDVADRCLDTIQEMSTVADAARCAESVNRAWQFRAEAADAHNGGLFGLSIVEQVVSKLRSLREEATYQVVVIIAPDIDQHSAKNQSDSLPEWMPSYCRRAVNASLFTDFVHSEETRMVLVQGLQPKSVWPVSKMHNPEKGIVAVYARPGITHLSIGRAILQGLRAITCS